MESRPGLPSLASCCGSKCGNNQQVLLDTREQQLLQ
jgi:hypothetical protein